MRLAFLLIICFGWASCSSDRINCPVIKSDKLKLTSKPRGTGKKEAEEMASVSARYFRTGQKSDLKDPATIEEWDCPRPGKNEKIARETRKRIERKFRQDQKRREKMESDSLDFSSSRILGRDL